MVVDYDEFAKVSSIPMRFDNPDALIPFYSIESYQGASFLALQVRNQHYFLASQSEVA